MGLFSLLAGLLGNMPRITIAPTKQSWFSKFINKLPLDDTEPLVAGEITNEQRETTPMNVDLPVQLPANSSNQDNSIALPYLVGTSYIRLPQNFSITYFYETPLMFVQEQFPKENLIDFTDKIKKHLYDTLQNNKDFG